MSKPNLRKTQHALFKKNIEKLQRAGLIGDIDFRKKATPAAIRRIEKYRDILSGKASVVKAPDIKTAAKLRKTLGLKGSGKSIVVPREKKERFRYQKTTGEIVSDRPGYNPGEKIHKVLGPKNIERPAGDKRLYYTIPERTRGAGRLKRKTFSSFDEMLYYMSKYDVRFEDIEDRIEIEEVSIGSRKDKARKAKEAAERAAATARYARRKKRKTKAKRATKKAR